MKPADAGWTMPIAGALVAAVAVVALASAVPGNIDDVFIVLVYARHLVESGSIYWNDIGAPVEGYTSPLDLAVKSAGTLVVPGDALQAAFWSTVFLHAACAVLMIVAVIAAHRVNRTDVRVVAVLAGLVLATNSGLAFGSSFLLETPLLVAAALLVAVLLFSSGRPLTAPRRAALGAALLALMLARPEGGPLALIAAGYLVVTEPAGRARYDAAIVTAAAFLALFAFLVWRRLYFGDWLPNTYYAKASDSVYNEIADGARYLRAGTRSFAGAALLAVATAGWCLAIVPGWRTAAVRRAYLLLALMAAAGVATAALSGGDSYPGERFLALPMALAVAMIAVAAVGLARGARWLPFALLIALLVVQSNHLAGRRQLIRKQLAGWPITTSDFACEAQAFRRLAAVAGDLPIAQSDCQRFKYFVDAVTLVDLHGLSDRVIARRPEPGPVTWGRYHQALGIEADAPVWIWGYVWMSSEPMAKIPLARLVASQPLTRHFIGYHSPAHDRVGRQMVARYAPASIPSCGGFFNFLVRRDHVSRFRAAGVAVGD